MDGTAAPSDPAPAPFPENTVNPQPSLCSQMMVMMLLTISSCELGHGGLGRVEKGLLCGHGHMHFQDGAVLDRHDLRPAACVSTLSSACSCRDAASACCLS